MSDMLIRWKVKGLHLSSLVPHFTGYSISFVIFTIDAFEYTTLLSATQLLMITREREKREEKEKRSFFLPSLVRSDFCWLVGISDRISFAMAREGLIVIVAHQKKKQKLRIFCARRREKKRHELLMR